MLFFLLDRGTVFTVPARRSIGQPVRPEHGFLKTGSITAYPCDIQDGKAVRVRWDVPTTFFPLRVVRVVS